MLPHKRQGVPVTRTFVLRVEADINDDHFRGKEESVTRECLEWDARKLR